MFGNAIGDAPLQVYTSALLFSPVESITRKNFYSEAPQWVQKQPDDVTNWTSCIQRLEGERRTKYISLTVSLCATWLAACDSYHKEIMIWDIETGRLLGTNSNTYPVEFLGVRRSKWFKFSPRNNNELVVLYDNQRLLTIWDVTKIKRPVRLIGIPNTFWIRD